MSVDEMDTYMNEENYNYLLVETFNIKYFGFELSDDAEYETARQIIQNQNNFIINGWKVSRTLPEWMDGYEKWNAFMDEKSITPQENEIVCHDDNRNYDEDQYTEEDRYMCLSGSASEESNGSMKKQKVDDRSFGSIFENDLHKRMNCEEDEHLFNSICDGDMKRKIADFEAFIPKAKPIDMHITGPFLNAGKIHWVIIFGESGKTYLLKPEFISKYLNCLLRQWMKLKKTKIIAEHCNTYYEIGIRKQEFGSESLWKRRNKKVVKRMSFVYSSDSKDGVNTGRDGLIEAIKFFFISMKKREKNPIGQLVIDHLKKHVEGLYNHLTKDEKDEDLIADKITNDIHQHFLGGFNLIWNDTLNHWLVDYDIIQIMRTHMGYKSWDEISINQKELCYRGFTTKQKLPDWNCEQERYY